MTTYQYGPPDADEDYDYGAVQESAASYSVGVPAAVPAFTFGPSAPGPAYVATPGVAALTYEYGIAAAVPYTASGLLMVASVDAPDALRSIADYTCDGTADDVQINAAIQQAGTDNTGVLLSVGDFNISDTLALDQDDLAVWGLGPGTNVKVSAGMATSADTFELTANRTSVRNMRLTGLAGAGRNGVRVGPGSVGNTDNTLMKDLYIDSPDLHGIGITCDVADQLIRYAAVDNVYVTNAGAGAGNGQGVVISEFTEDCSVTNLWATGSQESGLHTFNNDVGVSDNGIRHRFMNIHTWSNGTHGISISDVDECVVTNFTTWDNTTHGIRTLRSSFIAISNGVSRINGNDGVAITSSDAQVVITNVIAEANVDNGFDIATPSAVLTNCKSLNQTGAGDRGFSFAGTADFSQLVNCVADGNDNNIFVNAAAAGIQFNNCALTNALSNNVADSAGSLYRNVIGYVTENKGTDTIVDTATSVVVAHGLDVTPTVAQISVQASATTTNPVGLVWVDTIDATNFTVNVTADPGASGYPFGWHISI